MKIKYDLSNNYFKYFNEANGVGFKKKSLLKNKGKIEKATTILIKNFIIFFLISILFIYGSVTYNYKILMTFGEIYMMISFCYIYLLGFLFYKSKSKVNNHKGELIINKDGIRDESSDKKIISLSWNNIELVAVTNNTITIITNLPILFIINNDRKEEILKEIKKYSNVKILY